MKLRGLRRVVFLEILAITLPVKTLQRGTPLCDPCVICVKLIPSLFRNISPLPIAKSQTFRAPPLPEPMRTPNRGGQKSATLPYLPCSRTRFGFRITSIGLRISARTGTIPSPIISIFLAATMLRSRMRPLA